MDELKASTYQNGQNTIGIFRSSLDSLQDTLEALRHETFVHYGINLLAPGNKTVLLDDIIADKGNKAIVAKHWLVR